MKIFNFKRSFTLIELMVVVLIIMLLSGVIIVNVDQARKKARDAKRVSDLGVISSALMQYYNDNHSYPSTYQSLYPSYMASTPTDPKGGAASCGGTYTYSYTTSGTPPTCFVLSVVTEGDTKTLTSGACNIYALKNGEPSSSLTCP